MKRMKRCRGQFSWVWVWILIWRIDLECSTQILDILTPADGNTLILSFLFPNPFAINSRKNRGRRRTLGRQTPTSFPYKFIMNIGKFLPQILFAGIAQYEKFVHRCAANSRCVQLFLLSLLQIYTHNMHCFITSKIFSKVFRI